MSLSVSSAEMSYLPVSVISSGIFDVAFYHRRMIAFRNCMCYGPVEKRHPAGIRRGMEGICTGVDERE